MDELDAVARSEVQPGWHVFDVDGQAIGSVERVNDASFSVRPSAPGASPVDVAFDDIESADDGRIMVNLTADELAATIDEGSIA